MLSSLQELFEAVGATADRLPGSIALASRTGCMNYADLIGNIASVAEAAARSGIKPGQLVVPAVVNPDMALILTLALMRIGCRVGYTINLGLYDASGVPIDAVIADPASAQSIGRPVIPVTSDWFKGAEADLQHLPPVSDEFTLIVASSGSTGRPKLIELPAKRLLFSVSRRKFWPSIRVLPLFGSRTTNNLLDAVAALATGGMVIRSVNLSGTTVLDTMQLFRPDYVTMAPSLLVDLVRTLDRRPAPIAKVDMLRTLGARCAAEFRNAALERIARTYASIYGTEETGWIAMGSAEDIEGLENSAGKIFEGFNVAAFDKDGRELAPGSDGEIRVKGPSGTVGVYIGPDAAEQSAFRDGWFSTGDVGLIDENKNLILRGRASHVINIGGSKVSPEAVEEHLLAFDKIVEVGVTGVAIPEGYEQIRVAVVGTAAVSIDEVNDHLRRRQFLWPVQMVKNVSAIPKTHAGKIDRQALKRLCTDTV